jgi:hypothetical protein
MKMAGPRELDFALASFWEFVKIWKSGNKCKFLLTCDGGHGQVELVAELGAAEDHHFPPPQNKRRKKTPSQLRREERRRNERSAAQVECENEKNVEKDAKPVAEEATIVKQTKIPVIASKTVVETVDTAIVDEVCTDEQFEHAAEEKVIFSFKSDYGEEDITDTMKEEVFVNTKVKKANLVSRVRTSPLSAEHLCFVELEPAESLSDFLWPAMDGENLVVFQELKRIR